MMSMDSDKLRVFSWWTWAQNLALLGFFEGDFRMALLVILAKIGWI